MPIHKIEVSEYECIHCGYKWINRVNGINGSIPQNCAKCKRLNWNTGHNESRMSPEESGLRRRVKNLYKAYREAVWRQTYPLPDLKTFSVDNYLSPKVLVRFLTLDPPPTREELKEVLFSEELKLGLSLQNLLKMEGWIPDPEKPGWLKRDKSPYKEYRKLLKADAHKQQEIMQQVIDSRTRTNPSKATP